MDTKENLFANPWVAIGLPALTILLGTQIVRALFPLLLYVLGDRFGYSAITIGGLALLLILLSFLANLLRNLLSARVFLIVTILGVGLSRLALQLWPDNPVAYLLLGAVGTFSFICFFPVYLAAIRPRGQVECGTFGLGLQVGIILSILFNGMYTTYELNWQSNFINSLIVIVLVILQLGSLAGMLYKLPSPVYDKDANTFKQALPWAAIGPFIFLQLLFFANIAFIGATTGWEFPLAFALALAGGVAGFLGAGAVFWRGTNRFEVIGGGIVLFIVIAVVTFTNDFEYVLYLIGPLMLGEWFMVVLLNIAQGGNGRNSAHKFTVSNGIGWVLFVIFVFLFYAGYELPLPFSNSLIPNLAFLSCFGAGLLAIFAFTGGTIPHKFPITFSMGAAGVILLILVGFKYFTWAPAEPLTASGEPVRVMTYNLHNGVNPQGQLNLEAIAQAIETQNADIVALQEVSRGWIINGSVDMLVWLSQRLNMPYVWSSTEGEAWGNAVLSRYPIVDSIRQELPPGDLLLHRGILLAEIETGAQNRLNIINTHFHHVPEDSDIRVQQSEAILEFWNGRDHTLLMGDLNASPDSPEMQLIQNAGFIEGVSEADITPGYTFISIDPYIQLDYIWYTNDLSAADLIIPDDQASDHSGIAATISQR